MMGELKQGPTLNKRIMFFEKGVLHLRQPYVRSTGLLNETLHTFRVAPSRANKGGHYGCTPEQILI